MSNSITESVLNCYRQIYEGEFKSLSECCLKSSISTYQFKNELKSMVGLSDDCKELSKKFSGSERILIEVCGFATKEMVADFDRNLASCCDSIKCGRLIKPILLSCYVENKDIKSVALDYSTTPSAIQESIDYLLSNLRKTEHKAVMEVGTYEEKVLEGYSKEDILIMTLEKMINNDKVDIVISADETFKCLKVLGVISSYSYVSLRFVGINKVSDLTEYTLREILQLRGMGRTELMDVVEVAMLSGVKFKPSEF